MPFPMLWIIHAWEISIVPQLARTRICPRCLLLFVHLQHIYLLSQCLGVSSDETTSKSRLLLVRCWACYLPGYRLDAMSVDVAWDQITAGPDGEALAEAIRAFIHAKFQQITLPRFINAVHVHTFEFGSVCPQIELKDICDPLPDFYEDDEEDEADSAEIGLASQNAPIGSTDYSHPTLGNLNANELHQRVAALQVQRPHHIGLPATEYTSAVSSSHGHNGNKAFSAAFPRSGTPGIPGGTSNMGYFHLPVGGLSGVQTPLAAVAGGPFATHAWLRDQQAQQTNFQQGLPDARNLREHHEERPRTAGSVSSPELGSPSFPGSPRKRSSGYPYAEKVSDELSESEAPLPPTVFNDNVDPSDLQVVARVTYDGDVRMTLTAEIMLDYPMPSFVKIPLRLSITGMSFEGVAILAYIKKKMHFCFLDPDDAETLVGASLDPETQAQSSRSKKQTFGSLLQEIQVETEIGRQENGKQVLKNVSKVEKFVLEQVRKIFEEEFVFPSFWTFLV